MFGSLASFDRRSDLLWRDVGRIQLAGGLRAALVSSLGWIVLAGGYVGALLFVAAEAEARAMVASWPEGLESPLGRTYRDGWELSGGEWQRLAIARAMMRPAPVLVVLDEPTSALDPEAEQALHDRYAGAARRAAAEGGVTVLVSHRLSSVPSADLIVVLDDGRIAESGSHRELMGRGGLYAEMFRRQADAYS